MKIAFNIGSYAICILHSNAITLGPYFELFEVIRATSVAKKSMNIFHFRWFWKHFAIVAVYYQSNILAKKISI